jgi:putative ABC transport system permease protein
MLRNYFKIALRNLWRHKSYSFINISGLAVGMACCLLILLFVQDELAYDRFHARKGIGSTSLRTVWKLVK